MASEKKYQVQFRFIEIILPFTKISFTILRRSNRVENIFGASAKLESHEEKARVTPSNGIYQ